MKLKNLIVSVIVLAVLAGGAYLARRPAPPPAADARLNQSLVDRTAIEKAAKVRISDAGKTVELRAGDNLIRGVVDRVVRGENPLVEVNGGIYDFSQIESVIGN